MLPANAKPRDLEANSDGRDTGGDGEQGVPTEPSWCDHAFLLERKIFPTSGRRRPDARAFRIARARSAWTRLFRKCCVHSVLSFSPFGVCTKSFALRKDRLLVR